MLGASHFQIPAIKYAKKAGYKVITADYLPENPGHKFSDEYYNVSTIDKDAILKLSEKLNIDGILSYASDPGAPTAAYVAEKLGLPGNPYKSVNILQRKDLFRKLLKELDLNVPLSDSFTDYKSAAEWAAYLLKKNSIIVKPSDSSGSKGVSKITEFTELEKAFAAAQKYNRNGLIIIEEFIEKSTYEMDGDAFVWKGKLIFRCFGNQHNDLECNPYVPAGISFPYIQPEKLQQKAHDDIEKVLSKLKMKLGGINIEYLTDKNDNIYLLEIGPRNGGNLIPEVIKYSTGTDLIEMAVESALGKDYSEVTFNKPKGYYSSYIVHSNKEGKFKNIKISSKLKRNIIEQNIWKSKGDIVEIFNGSNATIGTMILQFDSRDEMFYKLDKMNKFIEVEVV